MYQALVSPVLANRKFEASSFRHSLQSDRWAWISAQIYQMSCMCGFSFRCSVSRNMKSAPQALWPTPCSWCTALCCRFVQIGAQFLDLLQDQSRWEYHTCTCLALSHGNSSLLPNFDLLTLDWMLIRVKETFCMLMARLGCNSGGLVILLIFRSLKHSLMA